MRTSTVDESTSARTEFVNKLIIVQPPPCGFLTFFPKRLGIFNQFFTQWHLLYVTIYAR